MRHLVAGVDGPTLMELQLIEPQLYFHCAGGAADRMTNAIDALSWRTIRRSRFRQEVSHGNDS